MPPTRRRLLAFTSACIVLVVLLGLGEVLARMKFKPHPTDERNLVYTYDRELGWFPIPDSDSTYQLDVIPGERLIHIHHNHMGFRDQDHVANGKPAIAFLGDSFVWGFNVEAPERFTDLFASRHPDVEVYNLGVSGYGTDQEYLVLQKIWSQIHPAVVFLVFCNDNDTDDNKSNFRYNYYKPYFVVKDGNLVLQGVPVHQALNYAMRRHPWIFSSRLACAAYAAYDRLSCPQVIQDANPTAALLEALNNFTRQHQSRLFVGVTGPNPLVQPTYDRLVESTCDRLGIPWVSLETPLKYRDTHWNLEGHRVVCDRVEGLLQMRGPAATLPAVPAPSTGALPH